MLKVAFLTAISKHYTSNNVPRTFVVIYSFIVQNLFAIIIMKR